MIKLEDFNSEKFVMNSASKFETLGGAHIVSTSKAYQTDKLQPDGSTDCGGDTEFEHTDIALVL
jgi:hypothetical protein